MANKVDEMIANARADDENVKTPDEVIAAIRNPKTQIPFPSRNKKQGQIFTLIQEQERTYTPPSNVMNLTSDQVREFILPELRVPSEKVFYYY